MIPPSTIILPAVIRFKPALLQELGIGIRVSLGSGTGVGVWLELDMGFCQNKMTKVYNYFSEI